MTDMTISKRGTFKLAPKGPSSRYDSMGALVASLESGAYGFYVSDGSRWLPVPDGADVKNSEETEAEFQERVISLCLN